jgi:hypothetical protein
MVNIKYDSHIHIKFFCKNVTTMFLMKIIENMVPHYHTKESSYLNVISFSVQLSKFYFLAGSTFSSQINEHIIFPSYTKANKLST